MNYQNSQMNYNSNNGVYDNSGKRIGYEVTAPSGVTNVFDNNGNRIGYSPSKRWFSALFSHIDHWLKKWAIKSFKL